MPLIDPGHKAPAFKLKDQDGTIHTLAAYAGNPVVLYFYPKDDTPGCTAESCAFRDNLPRFKKSKAIVLGASKGLGAAIAVALANEGAQVVGDNAVRRLLGPLGIDASKIRDLADDRREQVASLLVGAQQEARVAAFLPGRRQQRVEQADGRQVERVVGRDPRREEAGNEHDDDEHEAGRRGAAWRKVKPAHTLDLVVLAVEWGSGRRRGWLSNLHLGARDDDGDGFVMLGKTFKGLTDELLDWQTRELLARETHREGHVVRVRPELVVEVAFDGVQTSPRYPGGLALRFARVKRYRLDKTASQADSVATVRALHAGRHAGSG